MTTHSPAGLAALADPRETLPPLVGWRPAPPLTADTITALPDWKGAPVLSCDCPVPHRADCPEAAAEILAEFEEFDRRLVAWAASLGARYGIGAGEARS